MKSNDSVGVTFVSVLLGQGILNGVVNLQFGTYLFTPVEDHIEPDLAVSCRMRMDLECARQLHAALSTLLDAANIGEAPTEPQPKVLAN